jgi:hypothetical protein
MKPEDLLRLSQEPTTWQKPYKNKNLICSYKERKQQAMNTFRVIRRINDVTFRSLSFFPLLKFGDINAGYGH